MHMLFRLKAGKAGGNFSLSRLCCNRRDMALTEFAVFVATISSMRLIKRIGWEALETLDWMVILSAMFLWCLIIYSWCKRRL